jgi:undecaprenyl-diphosphatase
MLCRAALSEAPAVTLLQLFVIALVQGITEFLPISSSGHLALIPYVTDWQDQGILIDVAAHVGTLGAVVIYFHADVLRLLRGAWALVTDRGDPRAQFLLLLIVATVPAVVAGAIVAAVAPELFRDVEVIAWTMLIGAVLLYGADRYGPRARVVEQLGWRDAVLIGLAQALALVPGTSRAGITMTAARALGFKREDAAHYSMLMSMPIIAAAGTLGAIKVAASGDPLVTADALIVAGLSFVCALFAIWALMRWLHVASFLPLVIYRLLLAAVLMALVYG